MSDIVIEQLLTIHGSSLRQTLYKENDEFILKSYIDEKEQPIYNVFKSVKEAREFMEIIRNDLEKPFSRKFEIRDGMYMDDKMAYEYDMEKMSEKEDRSWDKREDNEIL